jgi:hypothetical protein
MRKLLSTAQRIAALHALTGAMLLAPIATRAQEAHVIAVPGFADFLTVDGDTVWATNKGRVEHWSLKGKLADVALAHPCGAMAIANGALWVANCADGTLNRIDLASARLTATIATGIANPDGELNVVAGAGSVWVTADKQGVIARVDPVTNAIVASIAVKPDAFYLAFGLGSLWAVSGDEHSDQDDHAGQSAGLSGRGRRRGVGAGTGRRHAGAHRSGDG